MFEFIKYSRIKFRAPSDFCEPRGPRFEGSKKYTYDFLGSKLIFQAPSQIHIWRPGLNQFTGERLQDDLNGLRYNTFRTYNDSWMSKRIFLRQYSFFGPWFTGELGYSSFGISIVAPEHHSEDLNLIYPGAFENAIAGFITALYGHDEWSPTQARYEGPTNWHPVKRLPVPAVRFVVRSARGLHRDPFLCFPITRDRILIFSFSYENYSGGNIKEMDAAISPKPAQDLIDNIINSVELVPSPELEKELEEIRKTCSDLSVSEEFQPLQWPATVDKSGLKVIPLNKNQSKKITG